MAPHLLQAALTAWLVLAPSQEQHEPADVVNLGQKLRCPVCQGMPIGDSPAPMAQDMMRQVRRLKKEGQSDAEVLAYFTARYGDWVLLEPPKIGVGFWVWALPPMVFCAALLAVAWSFMQPKLPLQAPSAHGESNDTWAVTPTHSAEAFDGSCETHLQSDDVWLKEVRRMAES